MWADQHTLHDAPFCLLGGGLLGGSLGFAWEAGSRAFLVLFACSPLCSACAGPPPKSSFGLTLGASVRGSPEPQDLFVGGPAHAPRRSFLPSRWGLLGVCLGFAWEAGRAFLVLFACSPLCSACAGPPPKSSFGLTLGASVRGSPEPQDLFVGGPAHAPRRSLLPSRPDFNPGCRRRLDERVASHVLGTAGGGGF